MLLRFFNLRAEFNEFLKTHNKPKLLASMQVEGFHQCIAYLVDIFGSINEVNTKMQVDKKAPSASLLTDIKHHLNSLIAEFERYFPKLDPRTEQLISLTRDPFRRNVHKIPGQLQEAFLELTNNSALKDDFKELPTEHFWVKAQRLYPNITWPLSRCSYHLLPHIFASQHFQQC
ncbi:zinc finger BED domain-containing protein 5-like [Watersipora subatra]|uniref:zinc finger BED domain-containing protein 5-like n=1 Tax=Watersipora subatra TaxID=2589382 RepID=UPI00355B2E40